VLSECPVWGRSSYTNLIDAQLHSAMRLISGCLQPTHGCQCSSMFHVLLYVVERQLTIRFKSSNPIQIGLCVLMSLSIHLHGLHVDAQCGQTWHLSTQLRSGERTGRRLLWSTTLWLPTLLSDSQVSISLVIRGLWWTVSEQVKALLAQMGFRAITFLWLWPATDHEPHCWHVPIKGGLNLLHEADEIVQSI